MTVLDSFRLDSRVAIVTGGNRGLGYAIAQALAEAGAAVAIASRTAADAETAAAALAQLTGRECRGFACDVTKPEEVQALVDLVIADFGHVDILGKSSKWCSLGLDSRWNYSCKLERLRNIM